MADLFEFPDWATTASVRTRSGQREIVVSALYGLDTDRCPTCGDRGPLRAHGSKITTYRDLPANDGMFVRIEVARRRYLCIACGKTSLQPLPEMDGVCRMTHRLVRFVETRSPGNPSVGSPLPLACMRKRSGAWWRPIYLTSSIGDRVRLRSRVGEARSCHMIRPLKARSLALKSSARQFEIDASRFGNQFRVVHVSAENVAHVRSDPLNC